MAKECVNKAENLKNCTCTYTSCSRRGMCCECVQYHLKMHEIPGCFFSIAAEKSYDRSVRNFIKDKS
jgi:hypothetical protein